ncbi:MAG: XRE family transcriptional regulator [Deltaproteobacteria bacterium]|nr:XRE family transcriptional regulator [Deltaproteobacteria bacterium]
MEAKKLAKLKKMGGRVTSVQEFLGLSQEDMAVIEARLTLANAVRAQRAEAGLTQAELARTIHSSQARVAKMEGGDPQASLESMIRALAAAGSRVKLTITRERPKPRAPRSHAGRAGAVGRATTR